MDSKRPCNDVIQTPQGLVGYSITGPAYVFLKTFIDSLRTFRYLWFGVNFVYGVRDCSNPVLIFFLLITLTWSFIVSLTSLYLQHQGRNIPFSPHLLHQLSVCQLSDNGHSECWEVIPSCGFNLHFWYLAKLTSSHVFSFQGWIYFTSRFSFL